MDKNWTVKVADFGLSVVKKDAATKKEKHGPIGTPLWMAPEVLMNKEYNEKADVVRHRAQCASASALLDLMVVVGSSVLVRDCVVGDPLGK